MSSTLSAAFVARSLLRSILHIQQEGRTTNAVAQAGLLDRRRDYDVEVCCLGECFPLKRLLMYLPLRVVLYQPDRLRKVLYAMQLTTLSLRMSTVGLIVMCPRLVVVSQTLGVVI